MGRALNLSQFQHNVTDGTTTVGTGFVVNGSAKAWANVSSNLSTVNDSLNISSATDLGTANCKVTYANSLGNYPSASVEADASTGAPWFTVIDDLTAIYCASATFTNEGSLQDGRAPYFIIHGDLA
tara:strand:- start:1404 stop:1781 length:378 start_codon:yes stop_codon:yes gene_type:complete